MSADTFTGSLSTADGGITTYQGNWDPMEIYWTVTGNPDSTWHYSYRLTVNEHDFGFFLLETSPGFTLDNALNVSGPCTALELDHWAPGPSRFNLPDDVYGVKFDGTTGTDLTLAFDSPYAPVWGDFYAKDGTGYEGWNTGFAAADWDPLIAPDDGSYQYHLLRPGADTYNGVTPEPGTLGLVGLGLGALAYLRGRKGRRRPRAGRP